MKTKINLIFTVGLMLLSASIFAQTTAVTGTVTDENGPMPGVNIIVKGTTKGTQTDFDGNYTITAVGPQATLIFSYIGYASKEIKVNGQTTINVTLIEDASELDEVVLIGYGTTKKSDLTGAVSSIDNEEIENVSERSLENALQGRAAGVNISRGEGSPGSQPKIQIRGVGSIGNDSPLFIIDGVPQEPGNTFNPNDVESIEVLKDASAAAIYGARAAHGVVLITTKRGTPGKVSVSLRTSVGFRSAVQLPDVLNRDQYIEANTQARQNSGILPEPSWEDASDLPDTDWGGELFSPGLEQTYQLSVSGGNKDANFFVSAGYDSEEGIYVDNSFDRYNLRVNSDFKIGKYLKLGESLLVTRSNTNPVADTNREMLEFYRALPMAALRNPSNELGGWGFAPPYSNAANPVGLQEQTRGLDKNTAINGNVYAEVLPFEGLNIRGSIGFNYNSGLFREFVERYQYSAGSAQDIATLRYQSTDRESYNLNLVATYQKSIGNHNFNFVGGVERFTDDGIRFDVQSADFPVTFSESFALSRAEDVVLDRNTVNAQYRLNSVFGRLSYDYKGKYLFTGNIRRDGSSRFGANNQFGTFPSVSAGWRISEEDFMSSIDWISNLKLRASYGVLGSDRIGDYLFDANYTSSQALYNFDRTGIDGGTDDPGFYLGSFNNADVKWEEVEQVNIGMDLGLFNGKVSLTADYYEKTTNDLLVNVPLPPSYGVSAGNSDPQAVPVNVGSMLNSGLELAVNYRETFGEFSVDISGNAAWNRNEVQSLLENQQIVEEGGGNGSEVRTLVAVTEAGRPIGSFFGFKTEGIIQSQEEIDELNANSPTGVYQFNTTGPGDLRFQDISGPEGIPDGVVDDNDRTFIGSPFPDVIFGLNTTLNYKNFDMNLFFQGVAGVDIFNSTRTFTRSFFNDFNSTTAVFDAWTPQNPNNIHPRLAINDGNGNFLNSSDYFIEDGSYIKLRNIQLGYSLSPDVLSKIGLSNLRVFVNAQNIWTITGYEGLDPEVSGGQGNTLQGFDNLTRYPQTLLIATGLQLGF